MAPVLETGLRYDGGDATEETGFGFDVGGGLRLDAAIVAGLMVDARGHASLGNWGEEREQAPALRDWGVGGVIRWRPAGDGMGPEMSLCAGIRRDARQLRRLRVWTRRSAIAWQHSAECSHRTARSSSP